MIRIILSFDKERTKLAGNDFGHEIFDKQVKHIIKYDEEIVIEFPDRIDLIGSSFIQGFFEEIVSNIGIIGIDRQVSIESSIPRIKEIVLKNLV